jgi:hypothetical protein
MIELHVLQWVAQDCYYWKYSKLKDSKPKSTYDRPHPAMDPVNIGSSLWVGGQFTISNSKNKFIVLGCDTTAYLCGYQNSEAYSIGC